MRVSTRYQSAIRSACPDGAPSPVIVAGNSSPAVTFSALLFRVVLSTAAPRQRAGGYTAAPEWGGVVTAASPTPPMMIGGIEKWVPSRVAACSMATLAAT